MKGFAKLAAPLHRLVAELVASKSRWPEQQVLEKWSGEHQRSFEALKSKLTTAPVLAYADFYLPFISEVDARHGGLGAVLSQEHGGKVWPIAFASRSLRQTECNPANYSSMKLLALKWAISDKFVSTCLVTNVLSSWTITHLATCPQLNLGPWSSLG